jgi:hypothetical protein
MTPKQQRIAIITLTVGIELLCLVLRYGFGLDSTRNTASTIGLLTFGVRIHHGYIGAAFLMLTLISHPHVARFKTALRVLGWPLFLSDAIHHFFVLWPIEGTPQFDLFYPDVS